MALTDYTAPTVDGAVADPDTDTEAVPTAVDLGNVAATVTSKGGSNVYGLPNPKITLPPVAPVPEDMTGSDMMQRGATTTRAQAVVVQGRPQQIADAPMYSTSFMTIGPTIASQGLDAIALSINLGCDFRYVPNLPDLATLDSFVSTWRANGHDNSSPHFDTVGLASGGTQNGGSATLDPEYSYASRSRDIIRPAMCYDQAFVQLVNMPVAPGFTFSIAAMLNEGDWSFTDILAGLDSTAVQPVDAKKLTMRFNRDDLEFWVNGQLLATYTVQPYEAVVDTGVTTIEKRPTIIVWALDTDANTTSIVVHTPRGQLRADFRFTGALQIGGAHLNLACPGSPQYAGVGIPVTAYEGGLGRIEIFDMGIWLQRLDLSDCETVAAKLDGLYGVSS